MKRLKLFIHKPSVNKVIGRELNLFLNDKAGLLDAIGEVDKVMKSKGSFARAHPPCMHAESLLSRRRDLVEWG